MDLIEEVTKSQRKASDPRNCVWVSASAGSGKTKVLTDRVLRLLLTDTAPEKILCLTFTKAAAAEMSNRINTILKKWAIATEKDLITEISNLNGLPPSTQMLQKARRLFIKVLETPGGMKIMTIHSFCQSILKRFPIEAGVSPQFEVVEEPISRQLMWQAIQETLLDITYQKDLELLSDYFDDSGVEDVFNHILSHKNDLTEMLDKLQNDALDHKLKSYFNLTDYQNADEIITRHFSEEKFNALYGICTTSKGVPSTSDSKIKSKLKAYQESNKTPFLSAEDIPLFFDAYYKSKDWHVYETSVSIYKIIREIINRYELKKRQQSLMDYADLILVTKKLLKISTMSQWVLFKLDGGIDHILVDEAQDTNKEQWEIISLICEDFFSGLGSKPDLIRTIFAVGDKKQSIFSFQGADPKEFERMHQFFKTAVDNCQKSFVNVPLNVSFRSTQPVLTLVNYLLESMPAKKGVLEANETAFHQPNRALDAGLVEIWPIAKSDPKPYLENWSIPQSIHTSSGITRVAEQIADKIQTMLSGEILESQGRPIYPGDIMILVKKRSKMMPELVRVLKERNIPLAGVDRITLSDHIAVQDLLCLAKFVLLQDDDLNLACLLKSPIINLNEDDLFLLAHNRGKNSLFSQLEKHFPLKYQYLVDILNQADKMPVFEFFSYVLGPLKARQAFMKRLGNEVNEALDEFLSLTLSFEQTQTPSLQNFLSWFNARKVEIKRDLDQNNINAVRIMTVHASKGLQGNIVFIPDASRAPANVGKERFFKTKEGLPIFIAKASYTTPKTKPFKEARRQEIIEEYNRLLYVALTRAQDRLYISGYENAKTQKPNEDLSTPNETKPKKTKKSVGKEEKQKESNGNWYDLIISALPPEMKPDENGIYRIQSAQEKAVEKKDIAIQQTQAITLPDYLLTQAPKPTPLSKPLMPSRQEDAEDYPTDSALDIKQEYALKRGTFIHQLLEYLPLVEPQNRLKVAQKLKPDDIEIPQQVFEILERKDFQILFGKDTLAEVPVAGVLNGRVVSGQIDRLVVLENEVWIVDYKSGMHIPNNQEEVPQNYKNQLNAYKGLIQEIFSDKVVRTFLLWTQNLNLMEIK